MGVSKSADTKPSKGFLPFGGLFYFIAQPVAVCVAQDWDVSSAMQGHHLYNLRGEDLGRIECVRYDDYGQPAYIILSVMGNSKIVAIPFSALVPRGGVNNFAVNITRGQLRNSPGYSLNAAYAFCHL